jgi:hypothetical protein
MANSLAVLVPFIVASLQDVLRGTGFGLNLSTVDAQATAAGKGQTINLPGTAAVAAYDITPAATVPALVDTTPVAPTMTLSQQKGGRFHLTGEDWQNLATQGPNFRGKMVEEAIVTVISAISSFAITQLNAGVGMAVGAQGTDPFASDANILVDAWRGLSDDFAPDMGRIAALSTQDYGTASKLTQFQKLNEAPRGTDFATGRLGMLANFNVGYDQAFGGNHTAGTGSGYLVNAAAGYAIGDTVITVDTGSGTLLAGDVVHFGSDTANKYVVASLASTTLTLNRGLRVAVADNAAITKQATHRIAGLCVHPSASILAVRPSAETPDGDVATIVQIVTDPVTGISLRLAYYPGYHAGQWEVSAVYGMKVRRPNLARKLIA